MVLSEMDKFTVDLTEQFGAATQSITDVFNKMSVGQGTVLKGFKAVGELNENITHAPGAEIAGSDITLKEVELGSIEFKATNVETTYQDIQKYGKAIAIDKRDKRLMQLIGDHIETTLVNNMVNKAEGAVEGASYKSVLARAKGRVKVQQGFKGASVFAFVNTEDYYEYLSDADLSTQTMFGMEYVESFLGFERIFFSDKIEAGKVVVTATENLNLAYVPATGEAFSAIGLTSTENGLVGFKHHVDDKKGIIYTTAQFAIEGYAERVDAVVVGTIAAGE